MAIIIPSKNIYKKNNSKVVNNKINVVNLPLQTVEPSNEFDISVATESFMDNTYHLDDIGVRSTTRIGAMVMGSPVGGSQSYNIVIADLTATPYYTDVTVKVPVLKNNKYVDSLKLGFDEYGYPNIKYTVWGTIKTEKVTISDVILDGSPSPMVDYHQAKYTYEDPQYQENVSFPTFEKTVTYPVENDAVFAPVSVTAKIDIENQGNIGTITQPNPKFDENNKEFYILDLQIPSYINIRKASASSSYVASNVEGGAIPQKYDLIGTRKTYNAQKIEVSIYGNTIGIDLSNGSVSYGEGQKPLSLESNELLQHNAEYSINNNERILLSEHLSNSVLKNYKNGKETAVIVCDMDFLPKKKFYNIGVNNFELNIEDNYVSPIPHSTLIIKSDKKYATTIHIYCTLTFINGVTEKKELILNQFSQETRFDTTFNFISKANIDNVEVGMVYENSEVVIPMVLSANGEDRPMSYTANGLPKEFTIVNVKTYYNGASWQELTLQEVSIE